MELTHVNGNGEARMVDVGHKPITTRTAVAVGRVFVQPETLRLIAENGMKKGDVLATARIAGIMAAKKTAELIPLCHSLPLTSVSVDLALDQTNCRVEITATASCDYKTGEEMEALTDVYKRQFWNHYSTGQAWPGEKGRKLVEKIDSTPEICYDIFWNDG